MTRSGTKDIRNATASAAMCVRMRRYSRRPSASEIVATILVVAVIAGMSFWQRRTWIEAAIYDRPTQAVLLESPLYLMHTPTMTDAWGPPVAITNPATIESAFSLEATRIIGIRGLLLVRLASHGLTALFLALAMLYLLRGAAMAPVPAWVFSTAAAALYVWMPGSMAYHLALWSSASLVVMCVAALCWTDAVLERRCRDLPVGWMFVETVIIFVGAFLGAFFWIVAALLLVRRVLTRRWHRGHNAAIGITMMLVPAIMGAAAHLAARPMVPAVPRIARAADLLPGFWSVWMLEAFGVFGVAGVVAGTAAVVTGLVFGAAQRARGHALADPFWPGMSLALVLLVAPVMMELLLRTHSALWDVDTLLYAPAAAVVPFALLPALATIVVPSTRAALTGAGVAVAVACAVLANETPRYRGMLPQPARASALAEDSPDAAAPPIVDFRIRPVDDDWCHVYALLSANTAQSWPYLRIRGWVPDDAIHRLPEHHRDQGYADWFLPVPLQSQPDGTVLIHGDVSMEALDYVLTAHLVSTDARDTVARNEHYLTSLRLNPFEQDDVAVLRNAHFDRPRSAKDWIVPPEFSAFVHDDTDQYYRGGRALRLMPGTYYTTVSQHVASVIPLRGRFVRASAMVRAFEPQTARLMLAIGDMKFYGPTHPGDGGWHRIEVAAEVPWWLDARSLTLTFVHGNVPKQACILDEADLDIR